jgi:hypothetical protein
LKNGQTGFHEQQKWLQQKSALEFGVLPANVTEKTDKGNISASMSIVERFDLQLGDVKKCMEHLHARDLVSLTYVPQKLSDVDAFMPTAQLRASTRHDLFEQGGTIRRCILSSWSDITFADVVLWQRMISISHRSLTVYERGSDRILAIIVKKSCTTDFWKDIMVQRDESGLDEESWGGVMALYLSITSLFYAPEYILVALRQHFKDFETTGLSKTEGENVKVVSKHLGRINLALRQGNGLQYVIGMVVRGFKVASCPAFKDHFTQMANVEARTSFVSHRNRTQKVIYSQDQIFSKVKAVLKEAIDLFESHTSQNLWLDQRGKNITFFNVKVPRPIRTGSVCDNCKEEGHIAPNCPEDRDAERMKKNREERLAGAKEKKEKAGTKSKHLPVRDKSGNTKEKSSAPSSTQRPMSFQVSDTGEVQMWCGTCGSWCNHTKRFHKLAQKPGFRQFYIRKSTT